MIQRRTAFLSCLLPLVAACSTGQPGASPEHPADASQGATGGGGSDSTGSRSTLDAGASGSRQGGGVNAPAPVVDAGGAPSSPEADRPDAVAAMAMRPALDRLDSCEQLNEMLRERARTTMNAQLDTLKSQVLADAGTPPWCQELMRPSATAGGTTTGYSSSATNGSGDKAASPTSVSETNNQVVGVDEADLVKTDGQYLYLAQSNELRIVSAWPANQAQVASTLTLGGTAKKLLIFQDRVVVFVAKARGTTGPTAWMGRAGSDCTYGYDCDFSGDGSATDVVIVDVSNRTAPKIVRTMSFSGSLIAAREIGSTVHTVVSIGNLAIPNLTGPNLAQFCSRTTANPDGGADWRAAALTQIEEARTKNNALIDAATFDFGSIANRDGARVGATDCSDVYRELSGDGSAVTTVASFDLRNDASPTLASVISRAGAVYASSSSLYISVSHQRDPMRGWYTGMAGDEASTVHEFRIGTDPAQTAYLGSGVVPGRVLNQFSMDEYAGNLRIATTKGHVPDPKVESTLTVLHLEGTTLAMVGQVDGIAPTEDIRSVRFDGERGYLVSFKKTDPLFVLNLADPKAPAIVGELKIPGFSTYMHQLDQGHLLALGYEADDQGTFAWFNGIQLQIFDVTDPTHPSLLHKKVFGTRGSSSSALTDHLGFTFLRDRGLLTLPMSICDGGGNGQYGKLAFSGVVAINASVSGGIVELGRLEEPYPASSSGFVYGAACQDWWTNSNSVVSRTVVLDDFLYAISANRVRVQDLKQLGTDVRVVDLVRPDAGP